MKCNPCLLRYLAFAAIFILIGWALLRTAKRPCSIVLYSLQGCPWCEKAKENLARRSLAFRLVEYAKGKDNNEVMPNGEKPRTFPQLWVNGKHVGGYTQMADWTPYCASN